MTQTYHPLKILHTEELIGGAAKTVSFDVPNQLVNDFAWRAGQHLSVRFNLQGQETRRSYSISSSPITGDPLQITVKRVKGGLVSNHINDNVRAGDTIDVMPPFGSFCLDTEQLERRTHYFFGAGSGITPLYSMLHSVLQGEPHSVAYLAYGNKNSNSVLFKERFLSLKLNYGERLSVNTILSTPSFFDSEKYWRKGKIDNAAVEEFINQHPPYAQNAQYYICGPGSMNQSVKAALKNLDVPDDRIHMESYGGNIKLDNTISGIEATASIFLDGIKHDVSIAANQTVLEAVRSSGLNPPFSCQSGVCGACRANLTGGSVHMRARIALDDAEIANGAILTCQAVPTSETLIISYG